VNLVPFVVEGREE